MKAEAFKSKLVQYENAAGDVSCRIDADGFRLSIDADVIDGDNVLWLESIATVITAAVNDFAKQSEGE